MSGSLNKVMLIGNLARDPEVRTFDNGGKVCNLRLITNETWSDRDGNRQERAEGHNVVIFNERLVKVAEDYLKKGGKIYIEGMLRTRKYQDRDGNDRYTTEVELPRYNSVLTMLDQGGAGAGGDRDYDSSDRGGRDDDRPASGGARASGDDRSNERGGGNNDRSERGGFGGGSGGGRASGGRGRDDDDIDDDVPF